MKDQDKDSEEDNTVVFVQVIVEAIPVSVVITTEILTSASAVWSEGASRKQRIPFYHESITCGRRMLFTTTPSMLFVCCIASNIFVAMPTVRER